MPGVKLPGEALVAGRADGTVVVELASNVYGASTPADVELIVLLRLSRLVHDAVAVVVAAVAEGPVQVHLEPGEHLRRDQLRRSAASFKSCAFARQEIHQVTRPTIPCPTRRRTQFRRQGDARAGQAPAFGRHLVATRHVRQSARGQLRDPVGQRARVGVVGTHQSLQLGDRERAVRRRRAGQVRLVGLVDLRIGKQPSGKYSGCPRRSSPTAIVPVKIHRAAVGHRVGRGHDA